MECSDLITPSYIFDCDVFTARLKDVAAILGKASKLCFSIKANPYLIDAAKRCGVLLEVCSPGELMLCFEHKVDPAQIVYSGVVKGEEDTRRAIFSGVHVVTAESPMQFELVNCVAQEREGEIKTPVILRIQAGSQFGMHKDDAREIIKKYMEGAYPALEVLGLHYFAGTQRKNLKHQAKELMDLEVFINELEEDFGFVTKQLEYGPGLAYPYFVEDDMHDTLAPVRELVPILESLAQRLTLTVEMGRFLASPAGVYCTRVVDIKRGQDDESYYALVDGGIHQLSYLGQMMGMKCPHITHIPNLSSFARAERSYTLCGSLCTTNDVLVRNYRADLHKGDLLQFEHAGAYSATEAMFLFLSRDLPAIYLREQGKLYLGRKSQPTYTLTDVRKVK